MCNSKPNSDSTSDSNFSSNFKSNQIKKSKTDGNCMLTKSNAHDLALRSSNISVHPIKFQKKGLHVVYLNVQHLVPKFDEIKYILSTSEIDIFGACETFLNDTFCDLNLNFTGFKNIRKDRKHQKGGGGLVFLRISHLNIDLIWNRII